MGQSLALKPTLLTKWLLVATMLNDMRQATRVGVKELKNRLSAFLREVRQGRRILVTDRGEVVAELRPARAEEDAREAALTEWLEGGLVRPPVGERTRLERPTVRLPAGTGEGILDELTCSCGSPLRGGSGAGGPRMW